ncbi:TIGR03943 family putative permease subunit [Paenibacillus glycinis]|uniref:TIGR03943 family protein n=1 Tax=Paenibacillus glycinis TaxID=2697035 RepID=A0ABW9XNA6_9BACL|nr:TIGR03943 family protein [Paenibacillus glycinis]NBD24127.1 TIGR03943 family protein [Paenibacillus glycinis]
MSTMENKRLARHYGFRGLLLGGFTVYIVHLAKSGSLQYYIAPRMMIYLKLAALGLFVLAVYFVYEALQLGFGWKDEPDDCDCDHAPSRSKWRNLVLYGLFALPLAFGFALPDKAMGSDVVAVKGMNLNAAGAVGAARTSPSPGGTTQSRADDTATNGNVTVGQPAAGQADNAPAASSAASDGASSANGADPQSEEAKLQQLFPYDEYSEDFSKLGIRLYKRDLIRVEAEGFLEVSTTLSMYMDNFQGKTIDVSGFVYREPDMKPNQFIVSRLAMTCCSADSVPYGFLVESPDAGLKDDTWVRVTGTIGRTTYGGNAILRITAGKPTKIEAPKDPYVYPYNGDIVQLAK